MTARRAVVLVARREFSERIRQRSWRISTAVTMALVTLAGVLAGVIGGSDSKTYDVGVRGAGAAAVAQVAREAAPQFDARVDIRRFAGADEARAAVSDEEVDAALVGGTLVVRDDPPEELEQLLQGANRQVRSAALLREEGLNAGETRRALDPPPLELQRLEGAGDGDGAGVAFVAALLLYGQLVIYGLAVATGVVEEKASRVVEVLLSTIEPRALLAGKIIGIGLVGLVQLALSAVVGLAAATLSGAIELDATTVSTLAVVLVWFLFGYALYSSLYAISGVIVSRQEDLQSSSTPLTLVLVFAYLVTLPAIDDPTSSIAQVAALVPLTSPMVMPVLVALDEASAFQIVASLGLLAASAAALVPLGARIYEGAILRMGRPTKLVEAWRSVRG